MSKKTRPMRGGGRIKPPGSVGKKRHMKSIRSQWQRAGAPKYKAWYPGGGECQYCGAMTANNYDEDGVGWVCFRCSRLRS